MDPNQQAAQINGEAPVATPLPPPNNVGQPVAQPPQVMPVQNASLYVGDLHPDCTESQLFEIFNAIGPVVSVKVCRDAMHRRSLGYAYVNFHNASDAEKAIENLNYTQIKGKPCRIMWSQRDPALRKTGEGNVFVKHLDLSIDNKALYDTFSLFGNILSCKVSTDSYGNSKGYGFVHFETKEAAEEAIKKVNGMMIAGKEVFVGPFLSKNKRPGPRAWTNVYVKNIPKAWTKDDLQKAFEEYGEISSAVVMLDEGGVSKGFGFVDYSEPDSALKAVEEMDGKDVRSEEEKKAATVENDEKAEQEDGAEKEEEPSVEQTSDLPEKAVEGILSVCKAQNKTERDRELSKKFEELKLEKQKDYEGVNLYIKNLSDVVNDEVLKSEFSAFGPISSAKVMTDKDGISRGFGFVCFASSDDAAKAVATMHGKIVGGKPLFVAPAQRKDQRKAQLEAQHRRPMVAPHMYPYQQMPPMGMPNQQFFNQPQQMSQMMRPPAPMMRNSQIQFRTEARNTAPIPKEPSLSAEALVGASQSERKDMIGQELYPKIAAIQPELASKITGMLLEMDNSELLHLLESPEALVSKVAEAIDVLKRATYREALMK